MVSSLRSDYQAGPTAPTFGLEATPDVSAGSAVDLDVVVQIGTELLASHIRTRDARLVSDAELDNLGDLAVRAAIAFEWKAQDVAKIRATRLANEAADRAAGTAALLHARQQDLSAAHDAAEAKDRAVREAELAYDKAQPAKRAADIAQDQKEADEASADAKRAAKTAGATQSHGATEAADRAAGRAHGTTGHGSADKYDPSKR